ncbi:MAG: 2-oxoacid:acceptor oxidoreductase subunit alpha [Acidobacteria bacterium]|nr:2-oxoacid:acceptor oxidoreductase subunit alpha [Acidobacteriota bacterium]
MTNLSDSTVAEERDSAAGERTNDLTIHVATVNGSGSQSSNNVLMRAIFQMGIPVSGKNLFPSNIAGLPTWFTIRASSEGWTGRRRNVDVLVCMNPATGADDVKALNPGAICIFDDALGLEGSRDDVTFYPIPFSKIAGEVTSDSRLRKLIANMVYVGVVAWMIGIDREELVSAVERQFSGKAKAVELNVEAIDKGIAYAADNLEPQVAHRLQRMDKTRGQILIDGNSAAALGAMFGGVTVATWYPITPSSSLCEALIEYLKAYRLADDGKATFAVVQAEDEISAIGMVIGAAWAGARSMTATSGPGISLMTEFAGLGYFAEIPAVVWDIQRIGPSTGLPTRTSQGDLLQVAHLSHGDTEHIVLFPGSVAECFEFAMKALDFAELFQTPVFVLSDLDLGMNSWMSEPFEYPTEPINRGKVLTAEKLKELGGKWGRYLDVDGDGIPWRTLPGTDHPDAAYFTRGSGHNEEARYTEKPEDYVNLMERLRKKFETARGHVPRPVIEREEGARVGLIAFGSSDVAVQEARHVLRRDHDLATSYLRLRALPFTKDLEAFVADHDRIYVIEQNRDGQLRSLIRLELKGDPDLRSILHFDGLPLYARFVVESVVAMEGEKRNG